MTFEKDRIIPSYGFTDAPVNTNISEMSTDEECKIDNITANMHRRIEEETEKFLKSQLQILCGDMEDVKKTIYPNDELALATYSYKGKVILGMRISENRLSIEWDIADPLTLTRYESELMREKTQKGETQDVQ